MYIHTLQYFFAYMNILFILPFWFPSPLPLSNTMKLTWGSPTKHDFSASKVKIRGSHRARQLRIRWTRKQGAMDAMVGSKSLVGKTQIVMEMLAWHRDMVKWMAFNIFARLLKDEWCLCLGMVCLNAACLLSKNHWPMFSMKRSTAASCFLAKKRMHNLCLHLSQSTTSCTV